MGRVAVGACGAGGRAGAGAVLLALMLQATPAIAAGVLVRDIVPGPVGSNADGLTAVGSVLFFVATDAAAQDSELWKSDGTTAGTVRVADINPTGSSGASELTDVNGTLFFRATDGSTGRELWKSDGTPAGTVLVEDNLSRRRQCVGVEPPCPGR
jgi:ELWxxDGT repeat protein